MLENLSRREWLAAMAAATVSTAHADVAPDHLAICAFSKHFQWAGIAEMTDVCARLGYDGIDLTVPAQAARVVVGPGLVGRVLDGFGKPIDSGPPLEARDSYDLFQPPPGPLDRKVSTLKSSSRMST